MGRLVFGYLNHIYIFLYMSRVKANKTSDQLQTNLNKSLHQMELCQLNADYSQAETHRLLSQKLKRDLQIRRIGQMQQNHEYQLNQLTKAQYHQQSSLAMFWQSKLSDYQSQSSRVVSEMQNRHQTEVQNLMNMLEVQLPYKVKQSVQYLNLKTMEQHMAKQKLYVEAHKVQLRLQTLEKQQKQAWINARNVKIETAVNTLKSKHAVQLSVLEKKLKTGLDELNKERGRQQKKLTQKYTNLRNELQANQDKQKMAYCGKFPSKGGQGSPLLLTKSRLLSSAK